MAPKRQQRGQPPQQPPRPRQRSRRPPSARDTNLARKEACIAALHSCRNGADRAETAFNELVAKHGQDLDREYQLHRADLEALRGALTKLCGKHKISYTQLHHAFTKGAGTGPLGPKSPATAHQGGGKACFIRGRVTFTTAITHCV